jgi:3-methylcrotonyl-CoA carboxylase alpha subunit
MTEATREAMGAAAVEAARAIGYRGAGTVEFIVDGARGLRPDGFWFMEMNTRLQVEHPVTEAIAGVDLVEWQLRVAAGEPLPKTQGELRLEGHAMEARLYAEDPSRGFLPATGRLTHLDFPEGVRADAGVRAGDIITPWYDPMIAKIVVHAPDRPAALRALRRALEETRVAGSTTNRAFLARLARQPDFVAGRHDTGLIARELAALTVAPPASPAARAAAALAALGLLDAPDPLAGFALWDPLTRRAALEFDGAPVALEVATLGPRAFRVDGAAVEVAAWDGRTLAFRLDGAPRRIGIASAPGVVTVFEGAEAHVARLPDPLAAAGEHTGGDDLRAPMPGLVKRLAAAPGQTVARGEVLLTLEAMKMEHGLAAPRDGVVAAVHVAEGAQVEDGALLLALEPSDG